VIQQQPWHLAHADHACLRSAKKSKRGAPCETDSASPSWAQAARKSARSCVAAVCRTTCFLSRSRFATCGHPTSIGRQSEPREIVCPGRELMRKLCKGEPAQLLDDSRPFRWLGVGRRLHNLTSAWQCSHPKRLQKRLRKLSLGHAEETRQAGLLPMRQAATARLRIAEAKNTEKPMHNSMYSSLCMGNTVRTSLRSAIIPNERNLALHTSFRGAKLPPSSARLCVAAAVTPSMAAPRTSSSKSCSRSTSPLTTCTSQANKLLPRQ